MGGVMFLHVHDGVQVAYEDECPICTHEFELGLTDLPVDRIEAVKIDD
jgi:hypothetical protein